MYNKSLFLLALAGVAVSRDLTVGNTKHGLKIFDEKIEASPALWLRNQNVTISANKTDVINGIVIIDARTDKEGEVKIVDGGVGQQNVTVKLQSPTILRGFDFHIEVYAVPKSEYVPEIEEDNSNNTTDSPSTTFTPTTDEEKQSDVTTAVADISTTLTPGEKVNVPVIIGAEDKEQSRQNREISTAIPESTPISLTPEVRDEATSTTPASVTEEKESSSTTITSAHGAQISSFRPKFVGANPSHPMEIATDGNAKKSLHKREVLENLVEPMEVQESDEDVLSEEEDSNEEDDSIEHVVPKILLHTTDKFATPLPYTL